ncbi:MAG TPA: hypothetical protein VFB20_10720 [Burkholderiales bacterium]|nr:hypothetical protein [Burkholderiales bacterium]
MTARMHRIAVALSPLVAGALTAVIQALSIHHFDPWVLGSAVAGGLLTVYVNYVRSGEDPQVVMPPGTP